MFLVIVAALFAQGDPDFGKLISFRAGWRVSSDPSACIISRKLDSDTTAAFVRVKANPKRLVLLIGNPAWKSLRAGQAVQIQYETPDDQGAGTAQSVEFAGRNWLRMSIPESAALIAFTNSRTIDIRAEGKSLASIPTGGLRGHLALLECAVGSVDPFAQ